MAIEIKMPQLGETVVEGTVTKWLKQEGDKVEADELILEISTDKVDSEIPSSASGIIEKILVPEGETVSVGTVLALIAEPAGAADRSGAQEPAKETSVTADVAAPPRAAVAAEGERQRLEPQREQAVASSLHDTGVAAQARRESGSAQVRHPSGGGATDSPGGDGSKRGIISPLVRKLADENGIDLAAVTGTGTGGRIQKEDVRRHIEQRKSAAAPTPAPRPAPRRDKPARDREEIVPWSNIRRRTAEHMVASHLETARAWNVVEADWTAVVALRTAAKGRFREVEGFNLTYMPFLALAVCETLLEIPEVNATFDEERQANVVKHYVNLGIAVALEGGGLIVPVVKSAEEKNLTGMARAIHDIASRARTKKLSPDDLVGGTFTITNPGPFGSIMSVPIIPKGQTAILAFEAIEKRVVVTGDDAIAIRSMGFLPMSWDHRTIDGAEAGRFLAALRQKIETTDWSDELAPYLAG